MYPLSIPGDTFAVQTLVEVFHLFANNERSRQRTAPIKACDLATNQSACCATTAH